MRRLVRFACFIAVLCGTITLANAEERRPQFRPALLGSKPTSLINRIDTKALAAKGQKDGAVLFCVMVSKTGESLSSWTYRRMPGTEAFDDELVKQLEQTEFVPAIYNYQPVAVLLYGTAIYAANETPHVRIFLNQDPREIKRVSDFVAPQPVIGADSHFDGLHAPQSETTVPLTAVVDVSLKVDKTGNLQELQVFAEEPPLLGYAQAAMDDFRGAKFVPAFRDGDPVDSESFFPVGYKPVEVPVPEEPPQ